jgi:hypothetical protein
MKLTSSIIKYRKILAITLAVALILGTGFTSMIEEPVVEPTDNNPLAPEITDFDDTFGGFGFGFDFDEDPCDCAEDECAQCNPWVCDCNDEDCFDCNPWICEVCFGCTNTCSCCSACDDGCELCDPALYDCEDCGFCYACNIDNKSFAPPIVAATNIFDVANGTQLASALSSIADGGVINITESFKYTSRIVIDDMSVELNLNGNTLTIEITQSMDFSLLSVQNGATLNVVGTGTLDVVSDTFRAAISVSHSTLNSDGAIINATNNGLASALIVSDSNAVVNYVSSGLWCPANAVVTVNGNVDGVISAGARAKVTVNGNAGAINAWGVEAVVTVNGNVRETIFSDSDTTVYVTGYVEGVNSWGGTVTAWGGTITVGGNITGRNVYGVEVILNGTVTVNGSIELTGPSSVGIIFREGAENKANVTVNGTITAEEYINVQNLGTGKIAVLTSDQYDTIVERSGQAYQHFAIGGNNLFVLTYAIFADELDGSDVTNAIETEEPIVLRADADTTISAEVLQAIKDSEGTLNIILPNGVHISISAAGIGANPQEIDLNIELSATTVAVGQVPANSLIIAPDQHGEFGFTISIHIPHAQLAEAGLGTGTLNLFYISSAGAVSNLGVVQRQSDGSVIVSISSASEYYLWSPPAPVAIPDGPQMGDEVTLIFSIIAIALGSIGIIGWTIYVSKTKKATKR